MAQDDVYLSREEKRAQRRALKEAKARQALDDAVIQTLMAREAGREYVNDLLGQCGIFSSTFTGEALRSAFNEGRRSIGLKLLADIIRATPQAYITMLQENADGRRTPVLDRTDVDDERNYDSAGRWIGEGLGPDGDDD